EETEGAATDIYGLAAVLYRGITGHAPPAAEKRLARDTYQRLTGRFAGQYREGFLAAIDAALVLDPSTRPASIRDWRGKLGIAAGDSSSGYLGQHRSLALAGAGTIITIAIVLWLLPRPHRPPLPSPTPTPSPTATASATPTATPVP